MKTNRIISLFILLTTGHFTMAQTIAVYGMQTKDISISSLQADNYTRLELAKHDCFDVLNEFDMAERFSGNPTLDRCDQNECLLKLGRKLDVDLIVSGAIRQSGNCISIDLKLIDIAKSTCSTFKCLFTEEKKSDIRSMIGTAIISMHSKRDQLANHHNKLKNNH